MGRHHFRILQEDPRFELVAVVDPVLAALPEGSGVQLFRELRQVEAHSFDLAVIAAPTELHGQLVESVLRQKKHVLVEKPAAASRREATELVELAAAQGVCLAVGNIERCNPVVQGLRAVLAEGRLGELIHVEGTRAGAYPAHVKAGNNVFLDLMVHELDVFRMLLGPLTIVSSRGRALRQPGIWDFGHVCLESAAGVSGSVEVDWFSPQRRRLIRVVGSEGQALVDYIRQSLEIVGPDGQVSELAVQKVETLKVQLDQLYRYLHGQAYQLATGEQLIESVALVEEAQRLAVRGGG